ncbi:MAG: hypothetical protein ACXAEX_04535 [Promethearchaeota archaeon]|jgi:hypothetical protein
MAFENLMLVFSASITGIIVGVGGIITLIHAIKKHKPLLLLFSTMWLLYTVFWFMDAAAHYYYSMFLMTIAIIPQLIGVPCIFIFIDLIGNEKVNTLKITILFVLEIVLLYVTFLPNVRVIIPGYGVHNLGILRLFQVIFLLYFVLNYFFWSFRTWRKAPTGLKRLTTLHLFGSTLFSIVTAVFYALGGIIRTFNALGFIVNGVGAFITIIVIVKEPKLIYILPFKAYRVLVVDTNAGTALFKYDWAKLTKVEENIFSMVLQAVGSVLDEILKKGTVREIQMDKAILLIQHDKKYPIATVLVTSKSTKSLRYGLKTFYDQFIEEFYSGQDLSEISRFEDAKKLVEVVFDFVPIYIE